MSIPFKQNEYNENDFSHGNTFYKGLPRRIDLGYWEFDRYNQTFYIERRKKIISLRFENKWLLTVCEEANQVFYEEFEDFADAITKGNSLIYNF